MKYRFLTLVVTILTLLMSGCVGLPEQSNSSSDINLTFQKASSGEGEWMGTVAGDVQGNLQTKLLNADTSQPIWDVEFDWIIDAGEQSFTARLTGTLNTETGSVEMDGTVVEGWMLGAKVHEEGLLIDAETSTFEGTISIENDDGA